MICSAKRWRNFKPPARLGSGRRNLPIRVTARRVRHIAGRALVQRSGGTAVVSGLRRRGVPGVFLDLEPHLKGGGQFGGFSGPDGMGVALRGLCRVLDYAQIDYHLRDFDVIRADRRL